MSVHCHVSKQWSTKKPTPLKNRWVCKLSFSPVKRFQSNARLNAWTDQATQECTTIYSDFLRKRDHGFGLDPTITRVSLITYTTVPTTVATIPLPSKVHDYSSSARSYISGEVTGIAVGAGIGGVVVIGVLIFLVFHGVTRRNRRRFEIPQPKDDDDVSNGMSEEIQLDKMPVVELHTEHAFSGPELVRELATHETPVELSASPGGGIVESDEVYG
ncbi:hypothetical protein F4779DRAFT_560552 [Xylariaceae sp. FL0662B]|nr:hypothetical protein F4779DRAFT_560552 [Xylariaceae sp. FL0662B]